MAAMAAMAVIAYPMDGKRSDKEHNAEVRPEVAAAAAAALVAQVQAGELDIRILSS